MDPVAFSIGALEIRWYGVMMAGSMLLGALIAAKLLDRIGRDGNKVWDGLFFVIIGGVVGARLVYVLTNLPAYFGEGVPWWSMFAVWQGGLSFHGGIIGGYLATYIYFKRVGIPLIEVLDAFALGVAPGIILVRIGNFMNGDILGYRWTGPWAMSFPHDSYHTPFTPYFVDATAAVPRHPTELYGMLVGLFCVVVAILLWNETYVTKRLNAGSTLLGFFIAYSVVRSFIEEPFRAVPLPWEVVDPASAGYGLFTTTQIASVAIIAVCLALLPLTRRWNQSRLQAAEPGQPGHKGASRQVRRAKERSQNP
jgi:phosphatidylglycerol:prolipoprotein diacylglycerol transferase